MSLPIQTSISLYLSVILQCQLPSNFLILFFLNSHHFCFHCFHVFVPSVLCPASSSNLPLPLSYFLTFSHLILLILLFPSPSSSPHLLPLLLLSASALLISFPPPVPLVADMSRRSGTSPLMKMKQPSMCARVHV